MPARTKTSATEPEAAPRRLPFFDLSRKVLLAAVGAAALAQDELEAFVQRLIERGEIAEKDGKKLIEELLERRKKARQEIQRKAGKRLNEMFAQLDLPTRQDVEQLQKKIDQLAQKIDELKQG